LIITYLAPSTAEMNRNAIAESHSGIQIEEIYSPNSLVLAT